MCMKSVDNQRHGLVVVQDVDLEKGSGDRHRL